MKEKNDSGYMVSPAFMAFFNTLLDAPIDIKRCLDTAGRAVEYLTGEIPIGQIEVRINATANRILPNGERRKKILYHKGEIGRKPDIRFDFETKEGGKTSFEIYAPKGYEYTEWEKENLDFISKQLFVFIGRARAGMMFDRAMREDGLTGIPNLTTFYAHGNRLIKIINRKT